MRFAWRWKVTDASGDGIVQAGEDVHVTLEMENEGEGAATGASAIAAGDNGGRAGPMLGNGVLTLDAVRPTGQRSWIGNRIVPRNPDRLEVITEPGSRLDQPAKKNKTTVLMMMDLHPKLKIQFPEQKRMKPEVDEGALDFLPISALEILTTSPQTLKPVRRKRAPVYHNRRHLRSNSGLRCGQQRW